MPRCVLAGSHPARHYVLRRDLAVITAEHAAAFHLLKHSHLTHVPKRPITRSQSARARDPSFLLCNPAATLIAKSKGALSVIPARSVVPRTMTPVTSLAPGEKRRNAGRARRVSP